MLKEGPGSSPARPPASLVAALGRRIAEILESVVPAGTRCALLDFPEHPNVGDSSIWLGERRTLRAVRARVAYIADHSSYAPGVMSARLGGRGMILLHGGGNLGDLWPDYQQFREDVIAAFPQYPIVQLPQSICFQDPANLRRAKAVFDGHPDLTLLVRDRNSLEVARNEFRARSMLCPDMALALGELRRTGRRHVEVLWIARGDHESAGAETPPGAAPWERVDWIAEPPRRRAWTRRILRRIAGRHRVLVDHPGAIGLLDDWLARQRLEYGRRLLSRARVVVTDRLHGHVLSLLLGIPHFLIGDRFSKVRNFYETWTKDCDLATWAGSPEAAARGVETMLAR